MNESNTLYDFGMIGLGTMGRNLLLNMGDHGLHGAGYDKDASKAVLLEKESTRNNLKGFSDIHPFVQSLKTPRAIMMLVPAGRAVDSVIEELLPMLDKGDILIDGGNSHFTDTDKRVVYLQSKGIHFFGMGISGGEEGARNGPSMMPGGDKKAYAVMRPLLEAIAARVDDYPCVAYIGPGSAGHFVKMVHNGIEYALMELIAETYGMMKNRLSMNNQEIGDTFSTWNEGRLQSFLLEITRDIFSYREAGADHLLLDDIKDEARAKGTGKWTSQVAMDLLTPVPSIDLAVSMRDLSRYKALRQAMANTYPENKKTIADDKQAFLTAMEQAFYFGMAVIYAQGMHLLSLASVAHSFQLNLSEIAQIWRGGCIIRSAFLNQIYQAYKGNNSLEHLLLDSQVASGVSGAEAATRTVVSQCVVAGIAAPAFTSALGYFDALRTARLPTNLIQAQRDFFGAHTYELNGREGVFHTDWANSTLP